MSYELDEIIPFSLGGSPIDYNNVQPAHRACNNAKSNKLLYGEQIEQAIKEGRMIKTEHKKKKKQGLISKIKQALAVSDW